MSLFKRPAWANVQTSDEDKSEENLFSHSHSYQDIVAEEQRKKKEKTEKAKAKELRRISDRSDKSSKKEDFEQGEGSAQKRRRITIEEGNDLLDEVLSPATFQRRNARDTTEENEDLPIRQTPRSGKVQSSSDLPQSTLHRPAPIHIENDSDDDDEIQFLSSKPTEAERLAEESDEEYAELVRQARARQDQQQKLKTQATTSDTMSSKSSKTTNVTDPSEPAHDPPIKLFISSRIPNTQPLIVYRKLSQRLKEIREAWCSRQGFSEETTNKVFLVHRMRRIYNVTTCKSLGLDTDSNGVLIMKGAKKQDGLDQIHLEAMTDEIFEQVKAERAREELKKQDLIESDDEGPDAAQEEAPAPAEQENIIRILLKAKGRNEPFKLKVKPTTLVSKIIAATRNNFDVSEEQNLFLEFDGERLDPDIEIQDTEIEDMDNIDVHVS